MVSFKFFIIKKFFNNVLADDRFCRVESQDLNKGRPSFFFKNEGFKPQYLAKMRCNTLVLLKKKILILALSLLIERGMEHEITQNPASTSIRKLYLLRRAEIISKTLEKNGDGISHFVAEICDPNFNATKDEILFARCLHWMEDNLNTKASIKVLAQHFEVSVRKIQRLFSFFAKKSYTTVLLDMRVEAAKDYLARLNNSIGEVAFLVGIKDHAYFTYLFRKNTGKTPSEYRDAVFYDKNSTNLS